MLVDAATAEDLPELLALMRGYCDFYGASPSDEGLIAMARALISAPDSEGILLVAREEDGPPIGFAAVSWKWSSLRGARVAIMEDLFVDPGARRGGAGRRLIEACAERARQLGAPCLEWMTALDNERAQSLYERAGAKGERWLSYELELGAPAEAAPRDAS